jgi:hypothetical protein
MNEIVLRVCTGKMKSCVTSSYYYTESDHYLVTTCTRNTSEIFITHWIYYNKYIVRCQISYIQSRAHNAVTILQTGLHVQVRALQLMRDKILSP